VPDGGLVSDALERLARLQDPLALLRDMFALSPVPYVIFDAAGHALAANPAYAAMFGALPPPAYNVLEDEIAAALGIAGAIRAAFGGETITTPTFWYDPKELVHVAAPPEARRVAISCTFFPLHDQDGEVGHIAIAYKDVTAELEARERVEKSEERLRQTLDAAEVGTWEWDIIADRVEWSSNIERIFGLEVGQFGGTFEAWLTLLHPDDRDGARRRVADALASGGRYEGEFRIVRPDGSIGWQTTRGYVVVGDDGEPRALRGVVVDVTAERAVEARAREEQARAEALAAQLGLSETRYRTFVEQSTEGIWRCEVTDPVPIDLPVEAQIDAIYQHGYLAECNDAMARMYGFEAAADVVGARLGDLLVREDPRNEDYLRRFIESGYRLEGGESVEVDRHGDRHVFHNSLVGVVEHGRIARAWGTQRDVTDEVRSREEAEMANRTKDEFLAMLGHELRNPLSPILTALELMRIREQGAYEKERAIIERQVTHVVRLVDDLLDTARIARGKVSLERRPTELADAIASARELAAPLIEQAGHAVAVDVPRGLIVQGDAIRLQQVFANLLTNAAKYTPPGGRIAVVAEADGERARVVVTDSGVGMRPEILARVFEPFVQEHQALDRSGGGLGVGLAIVRSLVELHGGTVAARSEGPGRGSELTVWLPLADRSAAVGHRIPTPTAAAPRDRRRILVVDDNVDAAETLAEALAALGHDVRIAGDGRAALALFDHFAPELGLLDLGLPEMDGFELARRIRALDGYATVPLIAVTGYGQESDRRAARAAGFDELLVKPVGLAAIVAVVSALGGAAAPPVG
jgi:PAS domain S-box-containing protein